MFEKKIKYINAYKRPVSKFWFDMSPKEQKKILFQKENKLFRCSEYDTLTIVAGIGSEKVRVHFKANKRHYPFCVRFPK